MPVPLRGTQVIIGGKGHQLMWKPIPNFPVYEASTEGQVRSLERVIEQSNGSRRRFPSKVLKPALNARGYEIVTLADEHRRHHTRPIHRLVLETFVGPRGEGQECCHQDGNRRNNHLTNLSWGTPSDNMADKIRHGTAVRGERVGNSVLKEHQILKIYAQTHAGASLDDLATEYGVSRPTIEAIKYGTNWKWLTQPQPPKSA